MLMTFAAEDKFPLHVNRQITQRRARIDAIESEFPSIVYPETSSLSAFWLHPLQFFFSRNLDASSPSIRQMTIRGMGTRADLES
jgi:hypothetical protein